MSEAVRAVVMPATSREPEVRSVPRPQAAPGRALVRLLAAGRHPVDLAIAGGRIDGGAPKAPYTAGAEAVGEVLESEVHPPGARVWCLQVAGCWGEIFTADEARMVPVPDGVPDDVAAAVGIAGLAGWMPVRRRGRLAAGEVLLVLGASGSVGQVAVQAGAGLAGNVVAAARRPEGLERAIELGASAVVRLGAGDDATALREACAPGADVVVDVLWGEPVAAALGALARGARVVQVGSAAGPTATITGGGLRGGRIEILGFSVFSEPWEEVAAAYADLAAAAGRGEVALPVERVPLADAPAAWERQRAGARGAKLVLVP